MTIQLRSNLVWEAIDKELFAVVGMVSARQEARTAGIVYVVHRRKLYFTSLRRAWKVRHLEANPHVSLTIPIAKRIPIMPWIKVPAATITFQGVARVMTVEEVGADLLQALFRGQAQVEERLADACVVEVTPQGEFVTYGVGVPLMDMRDPDKARGRAPVGEAM